MKPLTKSETESVSAVANAIVSESRGECKCDGDDAYECNGGFDKKCACRCHDLLPTFDDQWEEKTLDERAKWRDDNGPGI